MLLKYPPGATPLDKNEIAGLLPTHLETQAELNDWENKNILQAQMWAFDQQDIISIEFIRSLHERMFNETWKWAGEFRRTEKNIGIAWSLIPMAIKDLCDDVMFQLKHMSYAADELSIRLHHRLTLIHAFPNGNGRHARLMADLLIMQQNKARFTWGLHQNISPETGVRKQYIDALKAADMGDYSKLLLFART